MGKQTWLHIVWIFFYNKVLKDSSGIIEDLLGKHALMKLVELISGGALASVLDFVPFQQRE